MKFILIWIYFVFSILPLENAIVKESCWETARKRFLNKNIIFILNENQPDSTHYEFNTNFILDMSQKFPNSSYSFFFPVNSDESGKEKFKVVFEKVPSENVTRKVLHGRGERTLSRSEFVETSRNVALIVGIDISLPICNITKFCRSSFWGTSSLSPSGVSIKSYMDISCVCLNVFLNTTMEDYTPSKDPVDLFEDQHKISLSYRSLKDFKSYLPVVYDQIVCSMGLYELFSLDISDKQRNVRRNHYRKEATSMETVWGQMDKGWRLFFQRHRGTKNFTRFSWYQAEKICSKNGMDMMIVENESQLESSISVISSLLGALDDSEVNSFIIPIGLRRNKKTVGKRFEWMKNRDLKFSKWAPREPKSFPLKNCVGWKWEVTRVVRQFKVDTKHELGWATEYCNDRKLPYVFCHEKDKLRKRKMPVYSPEYGVDENNIVQKGAYIKEGLMYTPMQISHFANDSAIYTRTSDFSLNCNGLHTTQLLFSQLCDGIADCASNSDEDFCGEHAYANCTLQDEWTCTSKQCVPLEARCDLIQDCQDGSDEEGCEIQCQHRMCLSGRCLSKSWFCDGTEDCYAGYDEDGCQKSGEECVFLCNRTQCVTRTMLNDSVVDCSGPEGPIDETLGAMEAVNCTQRSGTPIVNNWAPKCVLALDNFGEIIGCRDFQHLQGCQDFKCPPGYLKCDMSFCIPLAFYGDGKLDCPNGEDEDIGSRMNDDRNKGSSDRLRMAQVTNAFKCDPGRVQSTSLSTICDGKKDCFNGADELNCGIKCPLGLICLSGFVLSIDKMINLQSSESLDFIDNRVRYLDFSEMVIPEFFKLFPRGRLTHLLILRLSSCSIVSVKYDYSNLDTHELVCDYTKGGADFQTVQKVDLSYNKLGNLPDCTYIGIMFGLRELNVSHNPLLSTVSNSFFRGLHELQVLDLSHTAINQLDKNIFDDLFHLTVLSLQATRITSLDFVLPASIHFLHIENCHIQHVSKHAFGKVRSMKLVRASNYKVCCPQVLGARISIKSCLYDNDETASCDDMVEEHGLRAPLFVLSFAILMGNGIALIYRLSWDKKLLLKPYGLFVTNLGVSDLLMGVYLTIIAVKDASYLGIYVLHDYPWRNSHACWVAGALATLSSVTSSLFLVLITVDRFMVVRYPYGDHRFTSRTMSIAVLVAWLFGLTVASLPLLPFARQWEIFSTNTMCLGLPFHTNNLPGWWFSAFVFIGVNSLLFFIIGAGQVAIFKTIRDKGKRSKRHKSTPNSQLRRNQRMQEYAIAKQLSLVVLTNFVCLFPVILIGLLTIFGHDFGPGSFRYTAIIILPVNAALNPALYTLPAIRSKWSEFSEERKKAKAAKSKASQRRKIRGKVGNAAARKVKLLIKCCRQVIIFRCFLQVERNRRMISIREVDRLKISVDRLMSKIRNLIEA